MRLYHLHLSCLTILLALCLSCQKSIKPSDPLRQGVLWNGSTDVKIYTRGITDTIRLFVISDTHLHESDEREDPYRSFSDRMEKGYNHTKHFKTLEATTPLEELAKSLEIAKKQRADMVLHLGDLISFPTELGAELALDLFEKSGLPWYYVAGNHDWHYEGTYGDQDSLRRVWSPKRLGALYKGADILNYTIDVKGLRIILMSNGTNYMLPSQVDYLKESLQDGMPSLLMMHVPLWAEGQRDIDFTIGNPNWGAGVDKYYQIERREQWPEHHDQADYDFMDEVKRAGSENLLSVIAGHVHFYGMSYISDCLPQFTLKENASGAYMMVTLIPKP